MALGQSTPSLKTMVHLKKWSSSSVLTSILSSVLSPVLKLTLVALFSSEPVTQNYIQHWLTISTILRIPGSVLAYSGLNEILDRVGDGVDWGSYVIVTASDIFQRPHHPHSTHRRHQYPGQTYHTLALNNTTRLQTHVFAKCKHKTPHKIHQAE